MASFRKRGEFWEYRFKVKNIDGTKREVTQSGFRTRKEAQIAASMRETELIQGGSIDGGLKVFAEYFEQWYYLYKESNLAPKTQKNYKISIKIAHDYFKKLRIKDITEDVYQKFLNDYGSTRAKETVEKAHTHFKQALKRAVKKGYIRYSPAEDVIVKGNDTHKKKERVKYLNEAEQKILLEAVLENINRGDSYVISDYAILVSLTCGLRFGELVGLGTDSFKENFSKMVINRTWDYQINFEFSPTKNEASNRTIIVDELTRKVIKQLVKYQLSNRIVHKHKLIFINNYGQPISNTAVNKRLKHYSDELGITNITHHHLRHSHISLLLYKKVNIKYVSRRAGHADIYTTLNTYSHIIDELEQSENDTLSNIICSLNSQTL